MRIDVCLSFLFLSKSQLLQCRKRTTHLQEIGILLQNQNVAKPNTAMDRKTTISSHQLNLFLNENGT